MTTFYLIIIFVYLVGMMMGGTCVYFYFRDLRENEAKGYDILDESLIEIKEQR